MNLSFSGRFAAVSAGWGVAAVDTITGASSHTLAAGGTVRVASIGRVKSTADDPLVRLLVAADDKTLRSWAVQPTLGGAAAVAAAAPLSLSLLGELTLSKKPTAVFPCSLRRPTPSASSVGSSSSSSASAGGTVEPLLIVGDRSGEVFAVPDPLVATRRRTLVSHTASIITALAVPPSEDFIISADRDARIRVSALPHAWRLHAVCSGHTKFVSAMSILHAAVSPLDSMDRPLLAPRAAAVGAALRSDADSPISPARPGDSRTLLCESYAPGDLLISGGGDGTLRLWYWRAGVLLHTLYLQHHATAAAAASGSNNGSSNNGASVSSDAVATAAAESTAEALAFGAVASAGSHADGSFANAADDEETGESAAPEAVSSSSSSAAAVASEGHDDDASAAVDGVDNEEGTKSAVPAASAAADVAGAATDAERAASDSPSTSLNRLPKSSTPPGPPPLFPASIIEHGPSGLLAVTVEGEAAVRFVRVYMHAEPDALPGVTVGSPAAASASSGAAAAAGAAAGGSGSGGVNTSTVWFPQARLEQIGVIPLSSPVLCIAFAPEDEVPTSLAVAAATDSSGSSVGGLGGSKRAREKHTPLLLVGGVDPSPHPLLRAHSTTATAAAAAASGGAAAATALEDGSTSASRSLSFAGYRLSIPHPNLLAEGDRSRIPHLHLLAEGDRSRSISSNNNSASPAALSASVGEATNGRGGVIESLVVWDRVLEALPTASAVAGAAAAAAAVSPSSRRDGALLRTLNEVLRRPEFTLSEPASSTSSAAADETTQSASIASSSAAASAAGIVSGMSTLRLVPAGPLHAHVIAEALKEFVGQGQH